MPRRRSQPDWSRVRLLAMDVDGVLTDGSLFVGSEGEIFKRFHTLDGHGLKLLQAAGVRLGENQALPVVDHAVARDATLARYAVVKKPGV